MQARAEGLLSDAEDDSRAGGARDSPTRSGGLRSERAVSARPPAASPADGPAWGPRGSEAIAGAGPDDARAAPRNSTLAQIKAPYPDLLVVPLEFLGKRRVSRRQRNRVNRSRHVRVSAVQFARPVVVRIVRRR